jgi:hypothetical protein
MLALKFVYAFTIALAGTVTIISKFSSLESVEGGVVMGVA